MKSFLVFLLLLSTFSSVSASEWKPFGSGQYAVKIEESAGRVYEIAVRLPLDGLADRMGPAVVPPNAKEGVLTMQLNCSNGDGLIKKLQFLKDGQTVGEHEIMHSGSVGMDFDILCKGDVAKAIYSDLSFKFPGLYEKEACSSALSDAKNFKTYLESVFADDASYPILSGTLTGGNEYTFGKSSSITFKPSKGVQLTILESTTGSYSFKATHDSCGRYYLTYNRSGEYKEIPKTVSEK